MCGLATFKHVCVAGCCFSVRGFGSSGKFLVVGFISFSVPVSSFISRLLIFSGMIQCDRDDGYHHDAKKKKKEKKKEAF